MSNVKNYTEQGGERTVIGGELAIINGGRLNFDGLCISPAAGQVNSEATTVTALKNDLNSLLAKLQAVGLMERAILNMAEDSETSNKINTTTTYTNVSEEPDAWVMDAIITSIELIPAGAKVTVNNPAISGTQYTVENATRTLWLSDIIKGQNTEAPTRTKLNGHTTQAFDFTVSGLNEDLTTDMTCAVVTSDGEGLEGTHQSEKDFGDYVILTKTTLIDVTFTADPD